MRGFTIIEIVIAVAVIAILSVIAFNSFSSFKNEQELANVIEEVVSDLRLARSKTIASENFSQYGVHFESQKVVIFTGTTYSAIDPNNIIYDVPARIEISSWNLAGGGADVIFQRLTGKTNQYGSITARVKTEPTKTKTVNIKQTGIIDA